MGRLPENPAAGRFGNNPIPLSKKIRMANDNDTSYNFSHPC